MFTFSHTEQVDPSITMRLTEESLRSLGRTIQGRHEVILIIGLVSIGLDTGPGRCMSDAWACGTYGLPYIERRLDR